jgi:hypothetical protein
MDDEDFKPRMRGSRTSEPSRKSYLGQIGRKAGKFRVTGHAGKDRSSLHLWGRGAAAGSLLAVRQAQGHSQPRRVTVKVIRFRLRGNAFMRTSSHLRYIVRDGVSKDGSTPAPYDGHDDLADPQKFARNCRDDPGHFTLIVSPEDGDQLSDHRPYIRRFMTQVEEDLGTSLEWLAVDHFDTGTPHTHILIRGADQQGKPLLIARDYISHGFRERAAEFMTAELGPELAGDQARQLRKETRLERVTDVDVRLAAESDGGGPVAAIHDDPFEQAQRTRRLRVLEHLGLARPAGALAWRLDPDMLSRLTEIDRRAERIAALRRTAADISLEQGRGGHRLSDPDHALVGALIRDVEPMPSTHMITLMIDGADGQLHSVEIAADLATLPLKAGTIVRVPAARSAMSDRADAPESLPDAVSTQRKVELLSTLRLPHMADHDGPTWLDQTLFGEDTVLTRDAGFGRALRTAQWQRQRWLMEQGLLEAGSWSQEQTDLRALDGASEKPAFYSRLLTSLRQREFLRIAGQLSEELGLEFVHHEQGSPVTGTVRRYVDMSQGHFAVIEDGYQFRLVPWDVARKTSIDLPMIPRTGNGIEWSSGRGRSGPGIS